MSEAKQTKHQKKSYKILYLESYSKIVANWLSLLVHMWDVCVCVCVLRVACCVCVCVDPLSILIRANQ